MAAHRAGHGTATEDEDVSEAVTSESESETGSETGSESGVAVGVAVAAVVAVATAVLLGMSGTVATETTGVAGVSRLSATESPGGAEGVVVDATEQSAAAPSITTGALPRAMPATEPTLAADAPLLQRRLLTATAAAAPRLFSHTRTGLSVNGSVNEIVNEGGRASGATGLGLVSALALVLARLSGVLLGLALAVVWAAWLTRHPGGNRQCATSKPLTSGALGATNEPCRFVLSWW